MSKENNKIVFYRKRNIEIVKGRSNHSFPKHSHNAFCIGVVIDGKIKLNLKDQEYLLIEKNVYLIPPFTEHKIESVKNMKYTYMVICIKNQFLERYNKISLQNYVYKDINVGIRILNILQKFEDTNDSKQLEKDIKQFLIDETETIYGSIKQIDNEAIISVEKFIKEHTDETFKLKEISDYVHLSKYHLVRIFKRTMGVAPYQFYIQEKIKKIKQGLLKEQTLVYLANNLNFSDQSHLCNTFKKHVGVTPMQFKKNYKKYDN